jgi:hypothetical protein
VPKKSALPAWKKEGLPAFRAGVKTGENRKYFSNIYSKKQKILVHLIK